MAEKMPMKKNKKSYYGSRMAIKKILDKNFNDYKIINRTHFQRLFSMSQKETPKISPQPIVLLSLKGMVKKERKRGRQKVSLKKR